MGFLGYVAAHQASAAQCPLWVISVILRALTDVRYYPDSDRDRDQPARRIVPKQTSRVHP